MRDTKRRLTQLLKGEANLITLYSSNSTRVCLKVCALPCDFVVD